MNLGDPLTIMFGIMLGAALGGACGYVAGTSIGRTRVATPLATTIQLTRDQLATTRAQLERAGTALSGANANELAAAATLVARKLNDAGTSLARVGHKAKQEGSQ